MNENTQDRNSQNSVSDLTPAQVRRRIAAALGYHEQPFTFPGGDVGYTLVDKNGAAVGNGYNYWRKGQAWGECPDWPTDTASALALCQEIAAQHGARGWILATSTPDPVWTGHNKGCTAEFLTREYHHTGYEAYAPTPADALARLALRALEGGER